LTEKKKGEGIICNHIFMMKEGKEISFYSGDIRGRERLKNLESFQRGRSRLNQEKVKQTKEGIHVVSGCETKRRSRELGREKGWLTMLH